MVKIDSTAAFALRAMSPLVRLLCLTFLASTGAHPQCTEVWVGKANTTTRDPIQFKIFNFTPVDSVISVPDLCYLKQHYNDQNDEWKTISGKIEVCEGNGPPKVTLEESKVGFSLRVKCRITNCQCMHVITVLYCDPAIHSQST